MIILLFIYVETPRRGVSTLFTDVKLRLAPILAGDTL